MIQGNNNLSVLPFYRTRDEQNHRRPYAYGDIYPLYTPLGQVPPFQIIRQHSSATIQGVDLYRADGSLVGGILTEMIADGLAIQRYATDGYDIIRFAPIFTVNVTNEEGRYYLAITMSDDDVYYSDIITVVGDMSGYICLRWWDLTDLIMDGCRIAYENEQGRVDYINTLWLQTQLGKPDYEFDEEGETRDGMFFPEKMISSKRYRFNILASEYLCDVMRFIRLSDMVQVIDQYGNMFRCDTFLMTPKWETQGNVASVEVEFTCDTVAKKIGRGVPVLGSFNDDFNNDYDITNE